MTGERVCLDWWLGGWPLRWNDNFKTRLSSFLMDAEMASELWNERGAAAHQIIAPSRAHAVTWVPDAISQSQ